MPSNATLFADMKAAAQQATSVHVSGTVNSGGQLASIDMTLAGKTSLACLASSGGKSFTILSTDGKVYIKINKLFLRLAKIPAKACATACGKYLAIPASEAASLAGDISMPKLISQVTSFKAKDISSLKFVPATYQGQAVYQATDSAGQRLIVSRSGYLPLSITDGTSGSLTFSDWNTAVVPGPPTASQSVTIAQLVADSLG